MRVSLRILAALIIALLAGSATTVVIAIGIARYSAPPDQWNIFDDRTRAYMPGFEEIFHARPDTERLRILLGLRPGVRVLDISHYDAEASYEVAHPPRVQRRFITEVGWPSPALVTESSDIGIRFVFDQSDLGGPFIDAPGWQILGRGFVFNSLVFASAYIAAIALLRPSRRCCSVPPLAVCCICTALWLALGIAWAAYFLHDPSTHSFFTWNDAEYESVVGPVKRPPDNVPWDSFQGGVKRSFGSRVEQYQMGQIEILDTGDSYYATTAVREFRHRLGWPFFAFDSREQFRPAPIAPNAGVLFRFPMHWPGLLGNWLFFVMILLGLAYAPPWLRARWRNRHNRCLACGYPVGVSPNCTECGAAVDPQTTASR